MEVPKEIETAAYEAIKNREDFVVALARKLGYVPEEHDLISSVFLYLTVALYLTKRRTMERSNRKYETCRRKEMRHGSITRRMSQGRRKTD